MNNFPILYHKGKKDSLYSWRIWVDRDTIYTEHGLVDGKKQISSKKATSKNVGRSNDTIPEVQALFEAKAMWTFKKDRKYSETIEDAQDTLMLPMLAKDFFKRQKKVTYPCDIQPKLDGVRCLAYWEDGQVVLMSRSGKPYDVAHISRELEDFLPLDAVLDGEIYLHDVTFQEVTRLVKKHRPGESERLEYWAYDCPRYPSYGLAEEDLSFSARDTMLESIFFLRENIGDEDYKVVRTPTMTADTLEEVMVYHGKFVEDGFEGAIVRLLDDYPYIFGYRSDGLLKVKSFQDEEYKVVGWEYGVGKMSEVPTFICQGPNDKTFKCTPKGSMEYRRSLGESPDDYIGQHLKVQFFDKTEDDIPRFPVGIGFRLPEDM